MGIDSQDTSVKSGKSARCWPKWLKLLVSVGLIAHFSLIGLVYFSNNSMHRMPWADDLLQKSQPYLISMGWYTELLPMSLIGYEIYDKSIGIDYKLARNSRTWTSLVESVDSNSRWRRICQILGAFALNEDEEGIGQIALSIAKRARQEGIQIDQLRITTQDAESQGNVLLYQAWLVPLEDGDLTLVPELEPTRTVPVELSN